MQGYSFYLGPIFIGALFNWGLLGLLILQVYIFAVTFTQEKGWIKALVYTLFTLDIMQTAFTTHWAWHMLLLDWGNTGAFITGIPWSLKLVPIFAGIVSMPVQLFFAWRIWMLKRESIIGRCVSVTIVLVSLMQGLAAFANTVRVLTGPGNLRKTTVKITDSIEVWLIGSLICDILLASAMVTILLQARGASPRLKRTENMLTKLVIHTIETGAVTVVTASVEVALFLKYKNNYLHLVPDFGQSVRGLLKLLGIYRDNNHSRYSNVLLANLNGRARQSREWENASNTTDLHIKSNELWSDVTPTTDRTTVDVSRLVGTQTPLRVELSDEEKGDGQLSATSDGSNVK
ncbi:hypothetical protein AMATHDRAFT_42953 [Amanita thiersii Skay4041]|uniref:DUF6534 domain-containing protein n=1 Tax=Amanita thiersii Skay4041 TaxID=703135 RepID=A0A2A9NGN3_9AGAR|nr:hypothetical protein AMATHDRAFT_42953 [Amanita thiersii Skay4041]